jgi:uncharacterized protein (DUF1778 family)
MNVEPMEKTEQMPTAPSRYRIEIKVSRQEKALIVRGAELAKLSISEFVRSAAECAAREQLAKHR